uniref:Calponin-homology (CH) domain-containing protein n=1 Tax=Acrobeloides nanus TaxID=290746 RepID=A0A914CFY5_9BILA
MQHHTSREELQFGPGQSEEKQKWITIQMTTFKNWLNHQLQHSNVRISNLETDLSDGKSALTDIKLTNFRTNWNDGIALSALLDYCQPGLCAEWRNINPRNGRQNCQRALTLAEKYLEIPPIISAEHLSSHDLDELSCITYLSYFVRKGGPGYQATLENVQKALPDVRISDFERSWSDGYLLCRLVEAVGGQIEGFDSMVFDEPKNWVGNVARALDAALDVGVASLVGADEIADVDVEHLGVMALCTALLSVQQEDKLDKKITTTCLQNQQLNLDLAFAEGSQVRVDDLDVIIVGPDEQTLDNRLLDLRKSRTIKGAVLSFIPKFVGDYKVSLS